MRILVTGGSRGIGAAIVELALRRGNDVVFTYKSGVEEAKAMLRTFGEQFPHQSSEAIELDLSKIGATHGLAERLDVENRGLDAIVNNAGLTRDNLLVSMSDEEWDEVLNVNLNAPFRLIRALLPHFIGQRSGSIVNIASLISNGAPGQANYAASKAGLIALSRSVAKEYGRRGIRCNVVSPGFIDTEMTRTPATAPAREAWKKLCPSRKGRVGEPSEVANAVLFLLSEEA